jgi:hypothetical protein
LSVAQTSQTLLNESVYTREGNFAVFNQLGVKLDFSNTTSDVDYYAWLDKMILEIGRLVPGSEIAEKSYARAEPRLNTGVYYDTLDYRLLKQGLVLRTTCNRKTHAFCAFKQAEDDRHVRRDHRYVFEGTEKSTIQNAPTSPESAAVVKTLLARKDFEHPGTHLEKITGIRGEDLTPAVCLEQYRHPFFVWLDKRDALRCSMDRVQVYNLRLPEHERERQLFSEIELPIYPHIEDEVAKDSRVPELIRVLSDSLHDSFGLTLITDSKYLRAAKALRIIKVA